MTKGKCAHCGELVTKNSAKKHIEKCFPDVSEKPNAFIVRVQWPHINPIYWLYLAIPFDSTLNDLDQFLRDIWLECCDHLSCFKIRDTIFASNIEPDPYSEIVQLSMDFKVASALAEGLKFTHEYDFGSPTLLLLEVMGKTQAKQIELLIRNEDPGFVCSYCKKKAEYIRPDHEEYYCKTCAERHDREEELLPLVNSPRTGVCGYTGS